MDFETARGDLKRIREEGCRDSERVVHLWRVCLSDLSYKMGDEVWVVYEQVFIAALDAGEEEVALKCLEALKTQFHSSSSRIKRLLGMYLEYKEEFEDARSIYEKLLEDDPANTIVKKRIISLLKAQGKNLEAIKELNKYLDSFMSDYEAWQELCDLYLAEGDYRKAAFCMEELILSNPHSHLFCQKYAEIKYTEGGPDNMEVARTYFAYACKINPSNMRALFGLFLAASNLGHAGKGQAKAKKENLKTAAWAAQKIALKYQNATGDNATWDLNGLEKMVGQMQITGGPSSD